MSGWRRTAACDRAARLISLELDGELGRREHAVLSRHLSRCPDCARLQESSRIVTTILRLAPHERPTRPVLLPERADTLRKRAPHSVAVVALAALVAIGAALVGAQQSPPASTSWTAVTLAEQARVADAQLVPPATRPPLTDETTTTPLPAQPLPACSFGCWPPTGV